MQLVGRYAQNFGLAKVLVVTDPGVTAAGWVERAVHSLNASGIACAVFDGVTPNPKDHEVRNGTEAYIRQRCDAIVAVGGGSPIDCAKGIGISVTNDRDVLAFEGIDEVLVPGPPLICIPTTAGSSADVSQFAIITDTVRDMKIAIISKMLVPDVALVDPLPTTTMPPELTAATGMDALSHAFEAYVSTAASSLTDIHALAAVPRIVQNLVQAMRHPNAMEYRTSMMTASLMAGLAFSNASLGAVHAMAHALGGILDMPHGECNARLLRHVVSFNFPKASRKYLQIGAAMGLALSTLTDEQAEGRILERLAALEEEVLPQHGSPQCGVTAETIRRLAVTAYADPCLATNPRPTTIEDLESIYARAFSS